MFKNARIHLRRRLLVGGSATVLAMTCLGGAGALAADANTVDKISTATPIKHVVIIVGENRSFDHLYATYVPKNRNEQVLNLLSEGIINADGSPGKNFTKAHQFRITSAPNNGKYFISVDLKNKSLYGVLPAPDIGNVPAVSALSFLLKKPGGDPSLPPKDQFLFGTGGTGLPVTLGPDTRITNVTMLPPGPFQMTGPKMPYDAFTSDLVHEFFQMYQQMDCAIDKEHMSHENPTGCLHDLESAIATTYDTSPGGTPHDTGQSMAFFNMQRGDAPITKQLADEYTLSDNYHQPVMGGTKFNTIPLAFADQIYFSDSTGKAAMPIASRIYNPNPQANTLNLYTTRAQWFNCSDQNAPGIKPIIDYLNALPYKVSTKCDPDHYYPAVNIGPAFLSGGIPTGKPNNINPTNNIVPPVFIRNIGDVLNDHHIPWISYGSSDLFKYQANYPSLRADHMRSVSDLFTDLTNGSLPAVSYVKPDSFIDGHPKYSKWDLFEAFVDNIVKLAQNNKKQWAETAIFVTSDESGGYYDSGFIQPVDFFGTGPRIPMIAVSPFSTGGHISHVYNEHSSFVKFIERNWKLNTKLTSRSRDNLPNPQINKANPYVPTNMPAIGDLFDMFHF